MPGVSVADLVAPTDVLDGFRFTATALDDDGEAGLVTSGVFVAPDAVACTMGNPAWISPTLGTMTAIGSEAWWEDGMGARPLEGRDPSQLVICAGAPEFWEQPLMTERVFALGDPSPGEEVEGYEVTVFPLTSLDPDVVLDEGSLWVTEEGWPLKMQVHGTAPGGVLGVRDLDPEDPTTPKAFALGFELTDIELGSLMVRSPDGSITAGPIGGVEISLPDLGSPSPELQAAIDAAAQLGCVTTNTPLAILEPLGAEAGLGHFEVASPMEGFEDVTYDAVGTFVMTGPEDRVVTTEERAEARRAHAMLFFSFMAPVVSFFDGHPMASMVLPVDADGRIDLSVRSSSDEQASRIAAWDAETIEFEEGSTLEMSSADLMHTADGGLLSDAVLTEGWDRALAFADAAVLAVPGTATGDPQALVDLRAVGDEMEEMRALGCALLGHQWQLVEDFVQSGSGGIEAGIPLLAAEQKAQSLLLFFDYMQVMISYLERPDVDWLEADGVVLEDTLFPDDTAGEYLTVIGRATVAVYEFIGAFTTLGGG